MARGGAAPEGGGERRGPAGAAGDGRGCGGAGSAAGGGVASQERERWVVGWGSGEAGLLGEGPEGQPTPARAHSLEGGRGVDSVAAGPTHCLAARRGGGAYAAGENDSGQLGISDFSGHSGTVPADVHALKACRLAGVAVGQGHSAAVTCAGQLLSWGGAEFGQLGHGDPHVVGTEVPTPCSVRHVCYGEGPPTSGGTGGLASALDSAGGEPPPRMPGALSPAQEVRFVQVACGECHTLALAANSAVFAFGQGTFGALGLGDCHNRSVPTSVVRLMPAGVVQIAAGAHHSAALGIDGRVYCWGRGKWGQLGLGHFMSSPFPALVAALEAEPAQQVCCGADHTLVLALNGGLYAFGRGHAGQTGLNIRDHIPFPQRVEALRGHRVVQVAAGAHHSAALTAEGRVFCFGKGGSGQLGLGSGGAAVEVGVGDAPLRGPQPPPGVAGLSLDSAGEALGLSARGGARFSQGRGAGVPDGVSTPAEVPLGALAGRRITGVCAGGDYTFVFSEPGGGVGGGPGTWPALVSMAENVAVQMASLTDLLEGMHSQGSQAAARAAEIVEDMFSSPGYLVAGFASPGGGASEALQALGPLGGGVAASPEADGPPGGGVGPPAGVPGPVEAFPTSLNGLDVRGIEEVYQAVLAAGNAHPEIVVALCRACKGLLVGLVNVLQGIKEDCYDNEDALSPTWLKALLVLMQNPLLGEPEDDRCCSSRRRADLVTDLVHVMAVLPEKAQVKLVEWVSAYSGAVFERRFLGPIQAFISETVVQAAVDGGAASADALWTHTVKAALQYLVVLHAANETAREPLPFGHFHNSDLSLCINLRGHYLKWIQMSEPEARRGPLASICQVPFVLTPEAKGRILQGEANLQKRHEMRNSRLQAAFEGRDQWNEFFELRVDRENLLGDALQQLLRSPQELKKPLRVRFVSAGVEEEGLDEGGVTKEFFQLLVREVFNPDFAMFSRDAASGTYWFNPASLDAAIEFQLVGALLGLAIYNGVILDVHFPPALYKHLRGQELGFPDLAVAMPGLAAGLQELLAYEGDVQEAFALTFAVSYDFFGEMRESELVEGGADVPVTAANRQEYVELYVQHVLQHSIQSQLSAFYQGFHQVCGGPALALFRWEEIELLICGLPELDFGALERVTRYEGGFTEDSLVVQWVWEILDAYSLEEQKLFLFFTTGCDRSPVGGLAQMHFTIQRSGPDTNRLPTSHTCFNILLVPEYSSKDKLQRSLDIAIQNSEGFGLQ